MAITGDIARDMSRALIDRYFRTVPYPYTRHHIDSYDQFLQQGLPAIIKSNNPILLVKEPLPGLTNVYRYKIEIYVGGEDGTEIEIGAPTISLQNTEEVRLLFPNEARLRNLTYASSVYANIRVKLTYSNVVDGKLQQTDLPIPAETFEKYELFKIPIMLHSRYCVLNGKSTEFLREAGECPYDNGGYFIVDGAEKVLITRQEQAFNTLYVTPQKADANVKIYASMTCLSPKTRQTKRVSFYLNRKTGAIQVQFPFIRKPVPIFIAFRALGFQSDEEILRMIFPNFDSPEAKLMLDRLHPSILEAHPFLNTYTAIQYMKTLTKGFSEVHVLDILKNQTFTHMDNDAATQAVFLGDCVRKIIRTDIGFDKETDRDDTRNQRCLVSGFLVQMLFSGVYNLWRKAVAAGIDRLYNADKGTLYGGMNFVNIFDAGNTDKIFNKALLTDGIMRGFRGKWGSGLGEEKTGVLQALSRLSYCDFMSHCRRVVLDFDTGMKLTGPRKLHSSQYGYFCTSETPTGASIGITKNLTIMAGVSTAAAVDDFTAWLRKRANVYPVGDMSADQRAAFVPVYVNGGMFGYTATPDLLTRVLRAFKRSGCLPYSASIVFSVRDRRVYVYLDPGRPLRPLIWLGNGGANGGKMAEGKLAGLKTWRDLVLGTLPATATVGLDSTAFIDPLADKEAPTLQQYLEAVEKHTGTVEYVDPYEQNEAFIANVPEYIKPETTHVEVHPSTILSLMTSLIPFPHHNQSPRNQLSCSQSKQGISLYATNWQNRFDNTAHVLCYGEAPLTRSMYYDYLGEGRLPYGQNCILAIACWSGYNQEDGIVMNMDAVRRGLFRTMGYRSYEAFEEDDKLSQTKTRFGNPANVASWKELRPGLDYSKLDENGYIRVGEYVDENTVIVGAYMIGASGSIADASVTPQVWTRGRVEKVVVTVSNTGHRLAKVRVVQDRIPELGDKFCLTPEHEVLTEEGWKGIADVTLDDKVCTLNRDGTSTWNNPTALHVFENGGDKLYTFVMSNGARQIVTPRHRLYVAEQPYKYDFMYAERAHELLKSGATLYMLDEAGKELEVLASEISEGYTGRVYCISIPQEIFLVRHLQGPASWTGNSNRHGQKGTIGALLRGHDMPRTVDGLVPDMIMNPHAIPSRMTIAQNLEQLFGKAAALTGAVADGTAFMNDGSPESQIGHLLDALGYEKYGNEILYNGATGEQIPAYIFIGPVYGMRLKHMVEDKWQARGKGRKEQKTHQPTGGRGQQGGLKIGEMDRDSLVAHSITGYLKETFMNRSDGAVIPVCVGCGLQPIYNPRMGIAVCSMCDGPVRYAGDTAANLELLPPTGRAKSRIVEVEMPYATKLLGQEVETYLNMGMRYITTAGIERLEQLELKAVGEDMVVKELPKLIFPEIVVPERVVEESEGKEEVTVEMLAASGQDVSRLRGMLGAMEAGEELVEEALMESMPGAMAGPMTEQMPGPMTGFAEELSEEMSDEEGMGFMPMTTAAAAPAIISAPASTVKNMTILPGQPMAASMPASTAAAPASILAPAAPGTANVIAVDTSPETMAAEGLAPAPSMRGGYATRRQFRRAPAYGGFGEMPSAPQPSFLPGRTEVGENGEVIKMNAHAPVTVMKLGS